MLVISFSGEAGVGKNTAATMFKELMVEKVGYDPDEIIHLSFASALKDICAMLFGWDRQRLDDDLTYKESSLLDPNISPQIDPYCNVYNLTRREMMQKIGTDAFRNSIDNQFWIKLMQIRIKSGWYRNAKIGMFTDTRFMNEFSLLNNKLHGFFVEVSSDRHTTTDKNSHASEQEWRSWPLWHARVVNDFTPNFKTTINDEVVERFVKYRNIA